MKVSLTRKDSLSRKVRLIREWRICVRTQDQAGRANPDVDQRMGMKLKIVFVKEAEHERKEAEHERKSLKFSKVI